MTTVVLDVQIGMVGRQQVEVECMPGGWLKMGTLILA